MKTVEQRTVYKFLLPSGLMMELRDEESGEWVEALLRDAYLYRFLRNYKGDPPDPEAASLWEELITKGCVGKVFDDTVRKLMELEAAR